MVDNVTDKELMQKNVEEFSRLQSYMVLVEKDSDAYKLMKSRYTELKFGSLSRVGVKPVNSRCGEIHTCFRLSCSQ